MSIASAITAAQGRVSDCYTAISNKGGTLPATQNLANMPTAIGSISTGGTIDSLTITPTTSQQTITASGSVDGYSPITVNAVTSSIDNNITAGNIKKDVQILGVTGTYEGVSSTKYGCGIDNLLGNVNGSGVLQQPSSPSSDIIFTGVRNVVGYGLAYKFCHRSDLNCSVSFPNLTSLSGHHSLERAFGSDSTSIKMQISSVSLPNLSSISGNYAMYHTFENNSFNSVSFPELVTLSGTYAMGNAFSNCSNLTSVSFPKLVTISGGAAMYSIFSGCENLTSVSFPELTTITSTSAFSSAFLAPTSGTTNLTTVSFSKLETIYQPYTDSEVFNGCFHNQKSLSSISFPALKTTSFSTKKRQFNAMFNANTASTSGTCTVHFPSNLESTIQGLTGYPTFGGNASRIVLSFDLSATS